MGRQEEALDYLEQAYEERDGLLLSSRGRPDDWDRPNHPASRRW